MAPAAADVCCSSGEEPVLCDPWGKDSRGWAIRYGHRRRLARDTGRESARGRATFARSVNRRGRRRLSSVGRREKHPAVGRRRAWRREAEREAGGAAAADCWAAVLADDREAEAGAEVEAKDAWEQWLAAYGKDADCASLSGRSATSTRATAECERRLSHEDVDSASTSDVSVAGSQELARRAVEQPRAARAAATSPKQAPRWEEARRRAARAAGAFAREHGIAHRWVQLAKAANLAAVKASVAGMVRAPRKPKRPPPPPPAAPAYSHMRPGKPAFPEQHERILAFAKRGSDGWPPCWSNGRGRHDSRAEVESSGAEFSEVADYFLKTLNGPRDAAVLSLTRLQNPTVYQRYAPRGEETVMFHGCRTRNNEASIISNGFQVSKCVSGGNNYGTWFAYNAHYSNGGYVYAGGDGVRHIFVCMVSKKHVVRDDSIMRVVGQDCAYPLWLLRYRAGPAPPPPRVVAVAPRKPPKATRPEVFFEVRDGKWVPIPQGPKKAGGAGARPPPGKT